MQSVQVVGTLHHASYQVAESFPVAKPPRACTKFPGVDLQGIVAGRAAGSVRVDGPLLHFTRTVRMQGDAPEIPRRFAATIAVIIFLMFFLSLLALEGSPLFFALFRTYEGASDEYHQSSQAKSQNHNPDNPDFPLT